MLRGDETGNRKNEQGESANDGVHLRIFTTDGMIGQRNFEGEAKVFVLSDGHLQGEKLKFEIRNPKWAEGLGWAGAPPWDP